DNGHAGTTHMGAGAALFAHEADTRRVRSDEGDAGQLGSLGEGSVLGNQAVAGVDGIGAQPLGSVQNGFGAQAAGSYRRRSDPCDEISGANVRRLSVGVRVDGDRFDAEATARAGGAAGDLAAVGDEYPSETIPGTIAWTSNEPSLAIVTVQLPIAGS